MKSEKNRKYYPKCSNNFAADCNRALISVSAWEARDLTTLRKNKEQKE